MDKEFNALYKLALDKWGQDARLKKLVEECSELIVAIMHMHRAESRHELIDELADVLEMIAQVSKMFDIEVEVGEARILKRAKLREALEDE